MDSSTKKEAALNALDGMELKSAKVPRQVERIENRYLELFGKDYKYSIIHNANGEVCGHYPRKIVFLEYESSDHDKDRCPPVPERQARLEMVREVFLSAYSATVGLKSSASPSGAITGLLEQFARGVGLRGTNMIV
ncbi:UNVERIFIED_CONTAM: hypothetical protein FKN15_070848 [Acipenser sinensis]